MRTIPWLVVLSCALLGCATTLGTSYVSEVPGLSEERLLSGAEEPVLFLGAERDAPAVGYAASDLVVRIAGKPEAGRVPVQVLGPLEVRAHVPAERLSLRVQRRGRLRDTPVYVGPNDRVRVLGKASEPGRVRVAATPVLLGHRTTPYEGTYPIQGLATGKAAPTALTPEPGAAYELAAGLPFSLFDAPQGKLIFAPKPSPLTLEVTVLRQEGAWYAVRVGSGPYLIGYTSSQIKPRVPALTAARASVTKATPVASAVPARLLHEQGVLKRVAAGTQLFFNDAPLAVLHAEGWARVLAEYPNGEVDAFVAVNDGIAVRALLSRSALREAVIPAAPSAGARVSETPSAAATP